MNNIFNISEQLPPYILNQKIYSDGVLLRADITDQNVINYVRNITDLPFGLLSADAPYLDIVPEKWDKINNTNKFLRDDEVFAAWMADWCLRWFDILEEGAAGYIFGGTGKPGSRPFYLFLRDMEIKSQGKINLANHITLMKKRAFGLKYNYLYIREEIGYFLKSEDIKKPRIFNIPLTDKLRGYEGYNAKYKAKSPYLRYGNVWQITELFKNKLHICEKPYEVNRIIIETHTNPGDIVLDLFSGSGSCSAAARKLNRKWIAIELDPTNFDIIAKRMAE